jgi:hypothetical protein
MACVLRLRFLGRANVSGQWNACLDLYRRNPTMICLRLKQLYQIVQTRELAVSQPDVVRMACEACQEIEVCPAMSTNEYDARRKHVVTPKTEN